MEKSFLLLASIFGALGVALGAFGAHALENRLSADLLSTYETGVRYHFYHTLALLGVVAVISRWPEAGAAVWAGWLFFAGIVIFSGSLYVLAFTGIRWLGAITPIGGAAFIAGWLCLLWSAWQAS
jgi:uncharacterized membrane protein YgdD (TMEM256/DUF423 family)